MCPGGSIKARDTRANRVSHGVKNRVESVKESESRTTEREEVGKKRRNLCDRGILSTNFNDDSFH